MSTSEVAAALSECVGVQDVAVYGVEVPHADGRAGMAALVVGPGFDPTCLHTELAGKVPEYARPLFLRIVSSLEVTGTLKLNKQALMSQGFDPSSTADLLYFDDRTRGAYVQLDADLHARLRKGTVRL